jgi:hypothetical protein
MNEPDVREELRIIRAMVEKTRRSTAETGGLFVFWGALIIAAMGGTMILEHFELYRWIWFLWTVTGVLGWGYSIFYGLKKSRSKAAMTYAETATRYLGIACGVGFFLACFILPLLKIYSTDAIPVVFSLVAGILFFVFGGIQEWPLFLWIGAAWWAGSAGLAITPPQIRNPAFLGLFIAGYFIPSLLVWLKYRREQRPR